VYLDGSNGLPAGTYTLLPARYALLPGAFLVTPQSAAPPDAVQAVPGGASVVAGYRFNDLNASRTGAPLASAFEVAPQSVILARAQYDESLANTFLRDSAVAHDAVAPRLPVDSGQLVLAATQAMMIQGAVSAQAPTGGRGGLVDINSPVDILIAGPGASAPAGTLVLNANDLSAFGSESLLIGGVRQAGEKGTNVTVKTANVTVNNAGAPLSGADVILVAKSNLTLSPGAVVQQSGNATTSAAETLQLGSETTRDSGDGALVRVSNGATAPITRAGVGTSGTASLTVGAGARISGTSVVLDSTQATSLAANTTLTAQSLALDSGRITLQLANAGDLPADAGLVLSGSLLQSL
jgi:hypothetical protein